MSGDIQRRIDQFIYQGESLLGEIKLVNTQGKTVKSDLNIDFWSWISGEISVYMTEIPRARSLGRKYSKKYLEAQRKEQVKSMNDILLSKCDNWITQIIEFFKTISIKNKNLPKTGNSHLLLRKIYRIYKFVKPETRVRHGTSILKEIKDYDLIHNADISKILEEKDNESYQLLQKLEIDLREFIQSRLLKISKNWWKERIPNDVQRKAEKRKLKNEVQWPWHSKMDLPLIHFVDFTDYLKIVTRRDNWREIFRNSFKDVDITSGKLKELEPIRNAIAHNRELSNKEMTRLKIIASDILDCIARAQKEGY